MTDMVLRIFLWLAVAYIGLWVGKAAWKAARGWRSRHAARRLRDLIERPPDEKKAASRFPRLVVVALILGILVPGLLAIVPSADKPAADGKQSTPALTATPISVPSSTPSETSTSVPPPISATPSVALKSPPTRTSPSAERPTATSTLKPSATSAPAATATPPNPPTAKPTYHAPATATPAPTQPTLPTATPPFAPTNAPTPTPPPVPL